MMSSYLINSEDESVIEIGEMVFYERGLDDESTESKINEFHFDFAENFNIEEVIFLKHEIVKLQKLRMKFT